MKVVAAVRQGALVRLSFDDGEEAIVGPADCTEEAAYLVSRAVKNAEGPVVNEHTMRAVQMLLQR